MTTIKFLEVLLASASPVYVLLFILTAKLNDDKVDGPVFVFAGIAEPVIALLAVSIFALTRLLT